MLRLVENTYFKDSPHANTNLPLARDGKDDEKRTIESNSKKKEKKKKRTKFDEKYPRKSLPASPTTERVSEDSNVDGGDGDSGDGGDSSGW